MADIEGPEMTDSCLRLIVMEKSERLPITGGMCVDDVIKIQYNMWYGDTKLIDK